MGMTWTDFALRAPEGEESVTAVSASSGALSASALNEPDVTSARNAHPRVLPEGGQSSGSLSALEGHDGEPRLGTRWGMPQGPREPLPKSPHWETDNWPGASLSCPSSAPLASLIPHGAASRHKSGGALA